MTDRREEILSNVLSRETVPSLSAVAVRLVDLAASDTTSAKDLAQVIEKDPGLATRLLRLTNSAAYRRSEDEITSISRAVVMLGLREVRIMALSISMRDTLPEATSGFDYQQFWRASLHRAVLARESARLVAGEVMEEAFVAGLVQEMGLPLLLGAMTPQEATGFPGATASLREQILWQRGELDLDHRELGAGVLRHWGLPEPLVACQQVVAGDNTKHLPKLTQVADFARLATQAFFSPQRRFMDIYEAGWRRFEMQSEDVNQILSSALKYVGEAGDILQIDLDQTGDLLAVMAKANSALSRLVSQAAGGAGSQGEAADGDLVAVASQLKSPLASVGGFAQLLAQQVDEHGQAGQYAESLASEADRLGQALSEMSSLGDAYQPKLKPVESAGFLKKVEALLMRQPLEHVVGPPPPITWHQAQTKAWVQADALGLSKALRLLLSFGCHLLGDSPSGALAVHHLIKQGRVLMCVYGTGAGAPPPAGQDQAKNLGPELGLARARRIMKAHGGFVSHSSMPEKGGFLLTAALPQASAPD